jgi:uncharacterized protein (TIGR03435 family)
VQRQRMRAFGRFVVACMVLPAAACAQTSASTAQSAKEPSAAPPYEVATIKPVNPKGGSFGPTVYPNGRLFIGSASLKMLVGLALHADEYQITGGPEWASTERYDVNVLPPASSTGETATTNPHYTLSERERKMLQAVLADRFGLVFHRATRDGAVYILTLGSGKLTLEDTQHKDAEPGSFLFVRGEIADGELRGRNASMSKLAHEMKYYLERPVVDETGLTGSYDFWVKPFDPENRDVSVAVFGALQRLGLKLKAGRGPVETVVIDKATRPTEN